MIAEFSIVPIGEGESLSAHVAQAFKVIEESGIAHEHHAMGTNLEGEWDDVMGVIKACRDRLLETSNRVSLSIKIDDRKGPHDRLSCKVESARRKMGDRPARSSRERKDSP
jgi:uncharacterized protein (TIGR00106 family)